MTIPYGVLPTTPRAAEPAAGVRPNDAADEGTAAHGASGAEGAKAFSDVLGLLLAPSVPREGTSKSDSRDDDAGGDAREGDALSSMAAPLAVSGTDAPPSAGSVPDATSAATPPPVTAALDASHTPASPRAATANAIAPPEGTTVRRTLDLLAPEFRERLERVIDRMEREYGYRVEVVETFRAQSRQDALYAQGRTEPGTVVTWTRASNHTVGRAADVVIDGSFGDALPYERLMRVAREEGLRTLGSRDPGHVELPTPAPDASARSASGDRSGRVAQAVRPAVIARAAPSITSPPGLLAGGGAAALAPVAGQALVEHVAPVARVARVAEVARVAQVGDPAAPDVPHVPALGHAANAGVARDARDSHARGGANVPSDEPNARDAARQPRAAAAREAATEVLREARDGFVHAFAGADPASGTSPGAGAAPAMEVGHANMNERIARLFELQDAAAERPLSQVLLRLERPGGGEDRVRVDLRGNSVSATLDLGDQASADRLHANVTELQRALERHGLDAESLTVRASTRSVESASLARAAGASMEGDVQRAAASSPPNHTSSRERGARQDEQRASPDSHRHRSRREQKGDR